MALPLSGYHARAVTFGYMAKEKGVSSQANLLISVKVLVGNTISSGHHAKVVSSNYPLNKKEKEEEKTNKRIKQEMNKGKNGLGKNASMTGTTRLLQRHP